MSVQSSDMRPMRGDVSEQYLAEKHEQQPLPIQTALAVQTDALNNLERAMERLYDTLKPLFGPELPHSNEKDPDTSLSYSEVDGQANDNTARIRRLGRGLHTFTDRLRG